MPTINPDDIRKLAAAWRSADLDPSVADVADAALERITDIRRQQREALDGAPPARSELVNAVARGDLPLVVAIDKQRAAGIRPEDRSAVQGFASSAVQRVGLDLVADLTARGDLGTLIEAAAADVIEEALKLAPRVEGITDDRATMRADKPTRDAWARLTMLYERLDALYAAAVRVRRLGMALPNVPNGRPAHVIRTADEWNKMHSVLRLVAIATAPPPPSDEEIEAEQEARREQSRRPVHA